MSIQHRDLAKGKWGEMTLAQQLANVGSEVERAISWKEKENTDYSRKAYERALELLYLTKNAHKDISKLKELARIYELLVDYFEGGNKYKSSDKLWRDYFAKFTYLCALNRAL